MLRAVTMQPPAQPAPEHKPQPLPAILRAWADAALALVYAECCQVCGNERASPDEGFVCSKCRARVRWIEPPFCDRCGIPVQGAVTQPFDCANCHDAEFPFSYARSAVAARDVVLDVIHQYKYGRALWFEPFLANLLITKAAPDLAGKSWDMIVPVPLYPARERHREFNQAQRLARRLAESTAIPLADKVLKRVIATETQTRLSRKERRENVKRAFAPARAGEVKGARVVLVDDVFTTGATTGACAGVLKRAGAAEVCVWTLARGV